MPIIINTDGGSRCRHGGDPKAGAAWAFVVSHPTEGKFSFSGWMEDATNNEAEYQGMIEALNWLNSQKITGQVIIKTDSELVSRQLSGQYEVTKPHLLPYWALALAGLEELKLRAASVQIVEIKRRDNKEADALCNKVMDEHSVVSR